MTSRFDAEDSVDFEESLENLFLQLWVGHTIAKKIIYFDAL